MIIVYTKSAAKQGAQYFTGLGYSSAANTKSVTQTIEESFYDKIARDIYLPIRNLTDISLNLLGSKTDVLRIQNPVLGQAQLKRKQLWDDEDARPTLDSNVLSNVVIRYPTDRIELYQNRASSDVEVRAIEMIDFLPVEMYLQWNGEYSTDPIEIFKGDLVVDVHFGDTLDEKIPIILQVARVRGVKYSKFLVRKTAELTLHRGELESDLQLAIDEYVASL